MDVNLTAILPEVLLTIALCAVLTLDLFLPQRRKWLAMPLSFVGVAATLAAVFNLAGARYVTLGGMFVVDRFAIVFKVIFCVAALIVFVISHDYLKGDEIHQGEYYFLILSSLLGMMTIASSRDLIAIFVSLELISIPTFVLAGIRKSDLKSNEAGLKFFLFGVLSSALMLFGMSLVYGITGSTNLATISRVLPGIEQDSLVILAIFFVIVGFGFKISAFPFHWWVPDTYEGSPVPVAAFLSVASKSAGFVALLQLMFLGFGGLADVWRPFLGLVAALTMTFGNLVALYQRHIIRLLAYSSIAQAGYVLIPLGVASSTDSELNNQIFFAALTYLLIYVFMETGAFASAIAFARRGGGYMISDYGGLFSRGAPLAVAMTIFLLSLAGMIPLGGFWAKFFVFRALIDGQGVWLAIVMAVNTVVSLFYYTAVVKRMFFDEAEDRRPVEVTGPLAATLALTAAIVVAIGVNPDFFGQLAARAMPF
ncbi:MAG: NADH-quinone oxidoreductase subunit N [Actinomycetota bacterium]|nr:NADH-quinone oxidoreductase subunit N [Actinomycetota bacterium]